MNSPRSTVLAAVVLLSLIGVHAGVCLAKEVARTRDGDRWLVAKRQPDGYWLVSYDSARGSVSGSVVLTDGTSVLIDCDVTDVVGDDFLLDCHAPDGDGWDWLASTALPRKFLGEAPDPAKTHPRSAPSPGSPPSDGSRPPRIWLLGASGNEGGDLVLVRSDDAGTTWQHLATFRDAAEAELQFVDRDHGWVATTPEAGPSSLFATGDGGDTWLDQTEALPSAPGRIGVVAFADPQRGAVAIAHGRDRAATSSIVSTADGGTSWRLSSRDATLELTNGCMLPDGHGFMIGEQTFVSYPPIQGPVGRGTDDFGANWHPQFADTVCSGYSTVWVGLTAAGLTEYFHSPDPSERARRISLPSGAGRAPFLAAVGDQHAWISVRSRGDSARTELYVTHDRGETWHALFAPTAEGESVRQLRASDTKRLLAIASDVEAGTSRALWSVSGGVSWRDLALPAEVSWIVVAAVELRSEVGAKEGS